MPLKIRGWRVHGRDTRLRLGHDQHVIEGQDEVRFRPLVRHGVTIVDISPNGRSRKLPCEDRWQGGLRENLLLGIPGLAVRRVAPAQTALKGTVGDIPHERRIGRVNIFAKFDERANPSG